MIITTYFDDEGLIKKADMTVDNLEFSVIRMALRYYAEHNPYKQIDPDITRYAVAMGVKMSKACEQ